MGEAELLHKLHFCPVFVQVYEATFVRSIEHKHMLARRHLSHISGLSEFVDCQLAAPPSNQLVSKTVPMATGEHATDTTPPSAH